jgi:hypothetical protein
VNSRGGRATGSQRDGWFGWLGLSVEMHCLVLVTTIAVVHWTLPSQPSTLRIIPVAATIDVETQAMAERGEQPAGTADARLLPSEARSAATQPRPSSGARPDVSRVEGMPRAASAPIPTATFAAAEAPAPTPEPAPAPAGASVALAGYARGAGTDPLRTLDGVLGRSPARKPSLGGWVPWDCPFPAEAAANGLMEVVVQARADVAADGTPTAVTIVDDPGFGFGAAARSCVLRQRLKPALDASGARVAGTTEIFRVHFRRE